MPVPEQETQNLVISEKVLKVEQNLRNISVTFLSISFSDILSIIGFCLGEVLRGLPVWGLATKNPDDLKLATIRYETLLDLPTVVTITTFSSLLVKAHNPLFFYHRTAVVSHKSPCSKLNVPIV